MPDSDLFNGEESLSKSRKVNINRRVEELCFIAAVGTRAPPIRVPQTPSAFHPLAQRKAFRRRGARQQRRVFVSGNSTAKPTPRTRGAV
jgi:hypothetical protein